MAKQYRHGDVFLFEVPALPAGASKAPRKGDVILALGEVTGHAHRIKARTVSLWHAGTQRYLVVDGDVPAPLTHEEHARIDVPPGIYEVRIQRVYSPDEIRNVAD